MIDCLLALLWQKLRHLLVVNVVVWG